MEALNSESEREIKSHAERANEINLELINAALFGMHVADLDIDTVITFEKDPTVTSFLALPTFNGVGPTQRQAELYADEAKIRFENTTHWKNTLVEVIPPSAENTNSGYRVRIVLE